VNSRERVLTALKHEEPDKVPIDLGGTPGSTGIHAIAYNRLKKALGIEGGKTRVYDPWQQLAKPEHEVLRKIGADIYSVTAPPKRWVPSTLPDGSSCEVPDSWNPVQMLDGCSAQVFRGKVIAKMPKGGLYFDPVYAPLAEATVEDLCDFDWPAPFSFYRIPNVKEVDTYVEGLAEEARYWYENSDFALLGTFGGGIFEAAYGLRGFTNFIRDLRVNRRFVEALLDKLVETNLEYAKAYLKAVGNYVHVIMVGGEDMGTQKGPVISPATYREMIKPRHKELWSYLKKNTKAYIFVHCCGSIYELIPDLIDAGADILNPVQISAANMDSKRLKKEYGEIVTFWGGGCDTQSVLPRGTPKDVENEVKRRINDFAPGGGFIFAQVHNVQPDVPVENILAMYKAVHEYGKYPIGRS